MEKNEVIKSLLTNGAVSIKGLKVKSVHVTVLDTYVRISLTTDKHIDAFIIDENGTCVEGKSNIIFSSLFSILPILNEDDAIAPIVPSLSDNPTSMQILLTGATIDIIQQKVTAGEIYKNPWSDNAQEQVFDHDKNINHVVGIKLTRFAYEKADMLANKLMGISK